ncbi:hypothetical protein IPF37_06250 [bacterium]|nr:MAG: hypothetical protein IPF37_06250 [bacterium]
MMKIRLSLKNVMRLIAMSMVILLVVSERTAHAASRPRSMPPTTHKPHLTPIEHEEPIPTKPPRKKTPKVDTDDGGWESGEVIETVKGGKSKIKSMPKDTSTTAPTDPGVDFEPKPMPRKQVPVTSQPLLHSQPPITSQPKTWQGATPTKTAPSYAGPVKLGRSQSSYQLPPPSVKDDPKPLRRTQSFTYGTGKMPSKHTPATIPHPTKQQTIKSPLASIKSEDLKKQKLLLKKTTIQEESFQDRFKRLYPNKKLKTQPIVPAAEEELPTKKARTKHTVMREEEASKPTPAKDSDTTPTSRETKDEAKAKKGGISSAVQLSGIGMAGMAMLTMLPMLMGDPSMQGMMQMMLTMSTQGSGQMNQMAGGMQMDMTSLIAALVKQNIPASAPVVNALQDIRNGAPVSDAILKQLPPDVQQKILIAEDVLNLIQGKDSAIGDQANKMLAETQANIATAINKMTSDIQTQIDTTIKQANDTLESVLSQPEQIIAAATGQILNTTNLAQTTIEQGKVIVASEINRMTKIVDKAQQDIDLGLKTIDQVQQDILQGLSTTLTAPANVIKAIKSDPEMQTYVAHLLGFIVDVSGQLATAQEAEKQRIQDVTGQVKQTKDLTQEVLKDTAKLAIAQGKSMAVNKLLSVLKENGILLPDSDDTIAQIQAQVSDNIDKALVDVRARVNANTQEIEKSLSGYFGNA